MEVFKEINETYIDVRYPGDIRLLPEGMYSLEKARLFYGTSKEIFTQVKREIE